MREDELLSVVHCLLFFQINRIRMSINLALSHERNSESLLKIQRKARQLLLEYVVITYCRLSSCNDVLLCIFATSITRDLHNDQGSELWPGKVFLRLYKRSKRPTSDIPLTFQQ